MAASFNSGQLREGDAYTALKPVYCISILTDLLWKDTPRVHHRFRLVDTESGRVLAETLEIHTLELAAYRLTELDLADVSAADRWLYILLYA